MLLRNGSHLNSDRGQIPRQVQANSGNNFASNYHRPVLASSEIPLSGFLNNAKKPDSVKRDQ